MTANTVDVADAHFCVQTQFDADLVAAIKTLPSRRFDTVARCWLVPRSDRLLLERILGQRPFVWSFRAANSISHLTERCANIEGPRLVVRFPYDAAAVAAIRGVEGRRWDADRRVWTAPLTSIRAVREFALLFGLDDSDLVSVPDADPVIEPSVALVDGSFRIRFVFDRDLLQTVRDLPTAVFDAVSRDWRVSGAAAAEVADFVAATSAIVAEDAQIALLSAGADAARLQASRATDADIVLPPLGGTLLPFQRAGVAYALNVLQESGAGPWPSGRRSGGVLIGDEQGLGKTVQAIALNAALNATRTVVVCPSSLRLNWIREWLRWRPDHANDPPVILRGTKPDASVLRAVNIVGWEVLAEWQGVLADSGVDCVIYDEMHFAKTVSALRTQAAMRLADRTIGSGGVVIGLTGTPMLNRPLEVLPLIRILGRVKDFGGGVALRELALEHPHLLNRVLRSKCFVRRRKAEVLAELPPKRWVPVALPLSADGAERYARAEADFLRFIATEAAKTAQEAGQADEVVKQAAMDAMLRALSARALVAINGLRQEATIGKMDATHRWLEDFLVSGAKVVIFAWHRNVVEELAERHANGLKIYGGMTDAEKQEAVDRFQTDPTAQVLVCGIKAAGIGLTLTAASDVVFVEQGWNPAEMEQAADRCHRIGQTDSVTAWNLLAADTIDEAIHDLIASKRVVISAATDGDAASDADPSNVVLGVLRHLALRV